MNWDKGPLEAQLYALEQVRDQLEQRYTAWCTKESQLNRRHALGFYEGYASGLDYMGQVTRFSQLEGIMTSVHFHERNLGILDDCIQQVKDELSC